MRHLCPRITRLLDWRLLFLLLLGDHGHLGDGGRLVVLLVEGRPLGAAVGAGLAPLEVVPPALRVRAGPGQWNLGPGLVFEPRITK